MKGNDMEKKLNELARIVMPISEYINYSALFVNEEEKQCYIDGLFQKVNVHKFDTWMNLFAAKKYFDYCDLGDIYLKMDIEGAYRVTITGVNRSAAFNKIEEVCVIHKLLFLIFL